MTQAPLRILFYGTPDFSTATLNALLEDDLFLVCGVITQPDKPAGRGHSLQTSAVKKLAIEHKLPVFQPIKIKGFESEFLQSLSSLGPIDFGVVIAFGQILPQKVLDYPKFGCINIHASLLPRWRGAAPIQRAILAGDHETGVCIMKMEAGLDTGPVYSSAKIKILEQDNTSSLHDKLSSLGAKLLLETLPQIACSSLESLNQEVQGVTYAEKIKPADLLLDWKKSSHSLALKIRAFSPKPGAYSFLDGKRLKVLKALESTKNEASKSRHTPGQIIKLSEQGFAVQTGDGSINVLELQLEGKKAMPVAEFINGYPGLEAKVLES